MRAHGQDSGNNRSIILIMYIGNIEKNFAILMDKDISNFLKPCVPPFYLVKGNFSSVIILFPHQSCEIIVIVNNAYVTVKTFFNILLK